MSIDLIKLSQDPSLDSWRTLFDNAEPELEDIQNLINGPLNGEIFPLQEDIFNAFKLTPLKNVKVVILGQDPYVDLVGDLPRATGLAFSSRGDALPPSLRNIFNEIKREYPDCDIDSKKEGKDRGDISHWADQGVLLLNVTLTVLRGECNSHSGIWKGFITKTIEEIEKVNKNCIYVLWGAEAINLELKLNLKGKILKSSHPSSRSYDKPVKSASAFKGNNHFKQINYLLREMKKEEINWCS
jgi:uracil-DNA glycosylase